MKITLTGKAATNGEDLDLKIEEEIEDPSEEEAYETGLRIRSLVSALFPCPVLLVDGTLSADAAHPLDKVRKDCGVSSSGDRETPADPREVFKAAVGGVWKELSESAGCSGEALWPVAFFPGIPVWSIDFHPGSAARRRSVEMTDAEIMQDPKQAARVALGLAGSRLGEDGALEPRERAHLGDFIAALR